MTITYFYFYFNLAANKSMKFLFCKCITS